MNIANKWLANKGLAKKGSVCVLLGATSLGFAGHVNANTLMFSGNIANHNETVRVDFSLAQATTNVRIWTDSYLNNTNFDPISALWNADTGFLILQNDDNSGIALGQTGFDSGFSLAELAAGNYFFTLATFSNFAVGPNITNGFAYDGQTPIALSEWQQPSNIFGPGGFWRINFDDTGVPPPPPPPPDISPVPLPAAAWLFGTAIAGFAGFGRKKSI